MTRKHTMLAALIALIAIVGVPSAFAEIQVGNYGFTQMKDANIAFNTALDQFLLKIVEMANAINDNTAAITELQNTSGSDNQVQVDQNSADIQSINGTIYGPYGLESHIANNMQNIATNTAAIEALENITVVNGTDGQDGAPGAQGPTGTFENAEFYIVNQTVSNPPHLQPLEIIVNCNTGDEAVMGYPSTTYSGGLSTSANEPLVGLDGWKLVFIQAHGLSDYTNTVKCLDLTP